MKYNVIYKRNNEWLTRACGVDYEEAISTAKKLYIEGKLHVEIIRAY